MSNNTSPPPPIGLSATGSSPLGGSAVSIDQQLFQTIVGKLDEQQVRVRLVQLALSQRTAVGSCFLRKDAQQRWGFSRGCPRAGAVPSLEEIDKSLFQQCDSAVASKTVQTEAIADNTQVAILAPIASRGQDAEIMMLLVASPKDALVATAAMQKISAALAMWLDRRVADDSDWQVMALASIVELVGKMERQPDLKLASEELANMLAGQIGCQAVAVGIRVNKRMTLQAISGVSKIDHGSETSRQFLLALMESATRREMGCYPPVDAENNHLLQAHKQLATCSHAPAVLSQPLVTEQNDVFGAIVLVGSTGLTTSNQLARFTGAAAPAITSAMQVVARAQQNHTSRAITWLSKQLRQAKVWVVIGLLVAAAALMFLPVTYRVRCNCVTEAVSRRFAVAPFHGQILVGHAEAGDSVKAGEVLAEMDGRTINWELAGVVAERKQSIRTREIELAQRNIAKTMLSEFEYKRLVSQEAILNHKKEHLLIKSPTDGVILSGSLERAEAASVETGQVLFEIGPLQPIRIEVAIPDDEVSQVSVGDHAKVWIDGQEDAPVEGKLLKLHPRSETRDGDNVFIAELEFPNPDERLRPGMKGSARIDGQQRSLGWTLFHKPANWIRSRLTWW